VSTFHEAQVFEQQVSEMRHREGVHPIVIWRVAIPFFYQQHKPENNKHKELI